MVNVDKLRGVLAEKRKSQAEIAKMLGISERTFYSKMNRKVFDSDEIYEMCRYLGISDTDMVTIFFDPSVTLHVTTRRQPAAFATGTNVGRKKGANHGNL